MDTLSNEFEVVSTSGGSFSSTTKTVMVEIPDLNINSRWTDEVGMSYKSEIESNVKKFREVLKGSFDNLVKLDKSISLEGFQYNEYETDNYIERLTVKR